MEYFGAPLREVTVHGADRPLDLARRIADGAEIDWDKETPLAMGDEGHELLPRLRRLSEMVRACRTVQTTPFEDGKPTDRLPGYFGHDQVGPTGAPAPGRWRHLEIRGLVGRGGFGEVYRAWDSQLQRHVALKLLRADTAGRDATDRVLREGRLLARVRHPNVVVVHGVDQDLGRVGIWMEFVHGRSLEKILASQGRMSAKETASIGMDLCQALAAVHAEGLVHLDVKASNVLREEGGRIVLMDFGAGADAGRDGEARPTSGTPLYAAPEVLLAGTASARSDIYSLGVLLYHLVSQAYPVKQRLLHEIKTAHQRRERVPLRDHCPDLARPFLQVIEKALNFDPSARFASPGEMETALAESVGVASGRPRAARKPATRVAALVLVSAIAVALGWLGGHYALGPAPGGSFQIEAGLYLGSGARQRLHSGDRVSVGDSLTLRLESDADLYVYVVNEDAQGEAWLLFPFAGSELANPVAAGGPHLLPGRSGDNQLYWRVSTAGQTERFLVVASPRKLIELEEEVAALARPAASGAASYVSLTEASWRSLRGVGEIVQGPGVERRASTARLHELARELSERAESAQGAWVRQVVLSNPTP